MSLSSQALLYLENYILQLFDTVVQKKKLFDTEMVHSMFPSSWFSLSFHIELSARIKIYIAEQSNVGKYVVFFSR